MVFSQLQRVPRAETGTVPEEEGVNIVIAQQTGHVSKQSADKTVQAGSQVCTEGEEGLSAKDIYWKQKNNLDNIVTFFCYTKNKNKNSTHPVTPVTPRREAHLLAKVMSQLLARIMSISFKDDITVASKNVTPMCEDDATISFQKNVRKALF